MSKEAMKLALEHAKRDERHINHAETRYWCRMYRDIAEKAVEALAKPDFWEGYVPEPVKPAQREPVAGQGKELSERLKLCARNVAFVAAGRVDMSSAAMQEMFALIDHVCVGLDSPPAQRTWVGLTDEEVQAAVYDENGCVVDYENYAEAIEAKLKEKNT